MAATPSSISASPSAAELIDAGLAEMEECAATGEWQQIDRILKRLPQIVLRVPLSERRDALLAARASIERLRDRVTQESRGVGDQLATLKTGRKAAESYRVTSTMTGEPTV